MMYFICSDIYHICGSFFIPDVLEPELKGFPGAPSIHADEAHFWWWTALSLSGVDKGWKKDQFDVSSYSILLPSPQSSFYCILFRIL